MNKIPDDAFQRWAYENKNRLMVFYKGKWTYVHEVPFSYFLTREAAINSNESKPIKP